MKKVIIAVFSVLFVGSIYGQAVYKTHDVFTPKTLFAGTTMGGRTASTTMDDTTKTFALRGYQSAYVALESATNDSVKIYVAYRVSKDGTTFGAFTLFDSLSSTGVVGVANYPKFPDKAMGSQYVQLRVYGIAANGVVSLNPSATVTTKIVRVLNSAVREY